MSMPTDRDTWPKCTVVDYSFWHVVNELSLGATAPFEIIGQDEEEVYPTLFEDNEGEGVLINPWSIMRMRMQKAETTWTEIRFESK